MTEFTERHEQMLQETHNAVIKISTVLLGANGNPGLANKVDEVCQSHFKLRRDFWLLVGILIGTGTIAGTIIGMLNRIA